MRDSGRHPAEWQDGRTHDPKRGDSAMAQCQLAKLTHPNLSINVLSEEWHTRVKPVPQFGLSA